MTANAPAASPLSDPDWPRCGHGSDPSVDAVGCLGRRVEPYAECLADLSDADRSAYLAGLQPGADLDHRGTRLSEELLNELLARLRDPATDRPRLGKVSFSGAKFVGDARFDGATFDDQARFRWVDFGGDAEFNQVEFGRNARFSGARFGGDARFSGAKFRGDAWFDRAVFGHASAVGPLVCAGELILSEAVFEVAVTIEAATAALVCRRTRWASTAALRLRYAGVDLSSRYIAPISKRPRPPHPVGSRAWRRSVTTKVRDTSDVLFRAYSWTGSPLPAGAVPDALGSLACVE